ncbi:MAG TPA: UvrB/UvrC motif-containing protein [Planctomycetota bacterium]|nr:UvrB/UvrC motif-containing protein [Planctomycetota bacterium]
MKLCQNCNKNVAVVHSRELADGKLVRESNLCEGCAAQAGLPPTHQKVLALTNADILGLLNLPRGSRREADLECPSCGMKLQEFRVKGRLGCPKDYDVFRPHLEGLLEKVQGSSRHMGRRPGKGGPEEGGAAEGKGVPRRAPGGEKALEVLRRRLAQAVKEEKYEEAARIRDQIAEAERGRAGGKGPARA